MIEAHKDGSIWLTDGGQNAMVRVDAKTRAVKAFPLPRGTGYTNLNTAAFDGQGRIELGQRIELRRCSAQLTPPEAQVSEEGVPERPHFRRADRCRQRSRKLDHRLGIAAGILLAAVEGKQSS